MVRPVEREADEERRGVMGDAKTPNAELPNAEFSLLSSLFSVSQFTGRRPRAPARPGDQQALPGAGELRRKSEGNK